MRQKLFGFDTKSSFVWRSIDNTNGHFYFLRLLADTRNFGVCSTQSGGHMCSDTTFFAALRLISLWLQNVAGYRTEDLLIFKIKTFLVTKH